MAKGESRKNARAPKRSGSSPKQAALDQFRVSADGEHLTTDQGLRINDDQNSLKAGARGPSLLEALQGHRGERSGNRTAGGGRHHGGFARARRVARPRRGKSAPVADDEAIVVGTDAQVESIAQGFIRAIARHRNWSREAKAQRVPA